MRNTLLFIISLIALLIIGTTTSNANQNQNVPVPANPECTICHDVIDPVTGSDDRISLFRASDSLTDSDIAEIIAAIQ